MRRVSRILMLSGLLVSHAISSRAFAQEPVEGDAPLQAEKSGDAETPRAPADDNGDATPAKSPAKTPAAEPAVPPVAAPPESSSELPAKPKVGDLTLNGYFRGGYGASNQKGRMTCFKLAIPGELVSKYRLGNECEVWSELHLHAVAYADDQGTVAKLHFSPTVYIPTTYIGYSPNGTVSSPAQDTTSTGATISFPNLYVDIAGIPWLGGGTAWVGTRYYKRESVYISDFFYWNPSGVGGGVEDIKLGPDLRLSLATFAVDGEPVSAGASSPPLPMQVDLGFREDIQLRGIKFYPSGEFQLGLQFIVDFSNNLDPNGQPVTSSGWGATLQHVQQLLGGENKLAFQYGRGGGTGFGTLSRYYYPDFSIYFAPEEYRLRIVDVLTIQPHEAVGAQLAFVYQHDDLGNEGQKTDWYSAGARIGVALVKHAKLVGEVGYDGVKKSNGSEPQWLAKFTIAPTLTTGKAFMARPELRLFYTWATWNESARTASIDSGLLYTTSDLLSGSIFGLQGETWW